MKSLLNNFKNLTFKEVFKNEVVWVILLSLFFLVGFYGKVFLSPNSYLLCSGGDGIKNYYTYLYHIVHDDSFVYFKGMNYPYQELHFFTDGNPVLGNTIKLISYFFPSITHYGIGIYNLLMLGSSIISSVIILRIFKLLGVKGIVAIIGSVLIVIQDPLWNRLFGHLTLSFHFIIPLAILLAVKSIHKKPTISSSAAIIMLNICSIFTHVYLGIILSLFFGVFYTTNLLLESKKDYASWGIKTFLSTMVHVLFFLLITTLFDHITDRPSPLGFAENKVSLTELIVPAFGPTKEFYKQLFTVEEHDWESICYIGFSSIFILLVAFTNTVNNAWKAFRKKKVKFINPLVLSLSITALFAYLFASGKIYLLFGDNIQNIPFVNQIRVIGRFIWIFYFTGMVFVFYHIYKTYRYFRIHKLKKNALLYISIIVLGYSSDTFVLHRYYYSSIENATPNYFIAGKVNDEIEKNLLEIERQAQLTPYKAIMSFPSFFIGGEYFVKDANEDTKLLSFLASFRTGLPLISSCMSRTSLENTKNGLRLYAPNYFENKQHLQSLFHKADKLLIIETPDEKTISENIILSSSEELLELGNIQLKSLSASKLFQGQKAIIDNFYTVKPELTQHTESCYSTTSFNVISDNYIWAQQDTLARSGKVAFVTNKDTEFFEIFKGKPQQFSPDKGYIVSFWYYNKFDEKKGFAVLQETLPDGTTRGWENLKSIVGATCIDKEWTLVELPFKISDHNSKLDIIVNNNKENPLIIDDLLIREENQDVYQLLNDSILVVNNIPLSLK